MTLGSTFTTTTSPTCVRSQSPEPEAHWGPSYRCNRPRRSAKSWSAIPISTLLSHAAREEARAA